MASANDDQMHITEDLESMDCPVCLQGCIHPSKLPCGHIFCFLCVKGLKNHRCAMCRAGFPNEYLERPQLLQPLPISLELNEYQWFYKGRNGWWQYDERTCQEIESAYKKAQKQCTILVAGNLYVVDFDQMLQRRQADPARKRQVKRDLASIPKKGVAGLRLTNISDSVQSSDEIESNSSNLIATTDAAIRIASDIIDSTLAHADDHGEYRNRNGDRAPNPIDGTIILNSSSEEENPSDERNTAPGNGDNDTSNTQSHNNRDMFDEIGETFNIINPSSINNSFRSNSQIDEFFTVTLDEFRNLALNNIVDESDDNNEDNTTAQ